MAIKNILNKNLSVALLFSDMSEAKKISTLLRKVGVVAHIYNDLKDYWYGVLTQSPDLSIVDVKSMSDGKLMLKYHPKALEEELNLVFYYTQNNTPLLFSTYEIYHLGVICAEQDLRGQLKSQLKKLNHMVGTTRKLKAADREIRSIEKKTNQYIEFTEKTKERIYYDNLLKTLIKELDTEFNSESFYSAVESVLSNHDDFERFSCYELNTSGKKLISTNGNNAKTLYLPSLWLGKTCLEGIESFAVDMASQVVCDVYESKQVTISIKGKFDNPSKILFLKVRGQDLKDSFDWTTLERYLNGFYSNFEKQEIHNPIKSDEFNPWKLMDELEKSFYLDDGVALNDKNSKGSFQLVDVDFSSLLSSIREHVGIRFYWSNFYRDFLARVNQGFKTEFKSSCMGVSHLAFLVEKERCDRFFDEIKRVSKRFPYWRYFEDEISVIASDIYPTVRMVPESPEAYFRYIERKTLASNVSRTSSSNLNEQSSKKDIKRINPQSISRRMEL
jgi:hypothetical protein